MKSPKIAIAFATIYLIIFTLLAQKESSLQILFLMFSLSPLIVIWMVYVVLKYGKPSGKELNEKEWGYEGIENNQMGTFSPLKN